MLVLEASIQNFQDERRSLLERCVSNEEEIQKLHGHVANMKCRLEEAQGALQELGRENASLQVFANIGFITSTHYTNAGRVRGYLVPIT